jgi:hypothetical protein
MNPLIAITSCDRLTPDSGASRYQHLVYISARPDAHHGIVRLNSRTAALRAGRPRSARSKKSVPRVPGGGWVYTRLCQL